MIITSHMQTIIKINPCLLKLSRKQESVTDGRTNRRTTAITISLTAIARGGGKKPIEENTNAQTRKRNSGITDHCSKTFKYTNR